GERDIACWNGDYFAVEIVQRLGLGEEGAVRVGFIHYNTADEVDRLLDALNELAGTDAGRATTAEARGRGRARARLAGPGRSVRRRRARALPCSRLRANRRLAQRRDPETAPGGRCVARRGARRRGGRGRQGAAARTDVQRRDPTATRRRPAARIPRLAGSSEQAPQSRSRRTTARGSR